MLDYVADTDYETGYIDLHEENLPLYKEIEEIFKDKKAIGVKPCTHMHILENEELNTDTPDLLNVIQNDLYNPEIHFAVRNSLPISYEKGGVNIIFGEQARYIKKEDLRFGSIIDAPAAKILIKRGIDVGIEAFEGNENSKIADFTGEPREIYIKEDTHVGLAPWRNFVKYIPKENAILITKYQKGEKTFPGAIHYENACKERFLFYPFDAKDVDGQWGWCEHYARRRQLEDSIKWLSGDGLLVHSGGNYPKLHIIAKKNDKALSVAICNIFPDKIKNAKICINANFEKIKFVNCKGHKEGNSVVLDGILYPYEFAAFEIEL